jgi:hypothetical protein
MAQIAMNPATPIAVRARCYAELAQYLYAKRKAVEHTDEDGNLLEIVVTHVGTDEDWITVRPQSGKNLRTEVHREATQLGGTISQAMRISKLTAMIAVFLLSVGISLGEKGSDWSQGTLVSVDVMTFAVTPRRVAHRYRCVVSDGSFLYTIEYEQPIKIAVHDPVKFMIKKDRITLLDADGKERSTRIETRERAAP